MLQSIRERAQGIFSWVILMLIAISFALWGIQNYFNGGEEPPLAVVGSHKLYERDINRIYQQQYAQYLNLGFSEDDLKKQALRQLVQDQVLEQAVHGRRLVVSDDALREQLYQLEAFQTDGKFDKERFKSLLAAERMETQAFYAQLRRSLLMDQWRDSITGSAFLLPGEIDAFISLKTQTRSVAYVVVPAGAVTRTLSDTELEKYYAAHQADFRAPEQMVAEYLQLALEDLATQVAVTVPELQAFYTERQDQYRQQEQRRISHILFTLDRTADAQTKQAVLKQAAAAKQRLENGEDFAVLAKVLSQDPASASQGGDLGLLGRGVLQQPFEDAAFALQQGEVSGPVETSFGIHLIKVTEVQGAVTKSFAEARDEVEAEYRRNKAEAEFYSAGERLAQLAYEQSGSLQPAARALGLKILRTSSFTRDRGEGIAAEAPFRNAAFTDDVLQGKNSEPVELAPDRVVVLRVVEHQDAAIQPLANVRAEVEQRIRVELGQREAEDKAKALLALVEQGEPLANAAGTLAVSNAVLQRDSAEVPRELVSAVFKAPRPGDGKPVTLLAPLADGGQAVAVVSAVQIGQPDQAAANVRHEAQELLEKGLAQVELNLAQDELQRRAKVKLMGKMDGASTYDAE